MNRISHARLTCALTILLVTACGPEVPDGPGLPAPVTGEAPTKVADTVTSEVASPAITDADLNGDRPVWTHEIEADGASYIAPHFTSADIPEGAKLVVRSPDGARSWAYTKTDIDRKLVDSSDGFWGIHIWGTKAVIELYTPVPLPARAIVMDQFAKGFESLVPTGDAASDNIAICGTNDGKNAICYASSEPAAYNKGKAVARLVINGAYLCTGWLLGSEGHLVTNNHCISSQSQAANTTFDFMAEGSSCSSNCRSAGACSGTIVAASSQLLKTHGTLDYSLLKLPSNPTGTYGYLQIRASGASVGERIYLPEHSAGWGKHLQMEQAGSPITVESLNGNGGSTCGPNQVIYSSDTQGGSSGSPVLGYDDNLVVALHHCGSQTGCTGLGVRIQNIVDHMGGDLPPNAIGGSTGPSCGDGTCNGSEDCNSCETDCGPCGGGGGGGGGGSDPNSCQESNACGGQAPGGCWCDSLCVQYGDCCSDGPCTTAPSCGDGTCNGSEDCNSCAADCGPCVDQNSCQQTSSCGAKAPGGCWCDSACTYYGDCCSDGPC